MLEGKLIIIPALGHKNKIKSSLTGSGLFFLTSQCGNNNELALQHGGFLYHVIASCKRPIKSLFVFLSFSAANVSFKRAKTERHMARNCPKCNPEGQKLKKFWGAVFTVFSLNLVFIRVLLMPFWKSLHNCFFHIYQISFVTR